MICFILNIKRFPRTWNIVSRYRYKIQYINKHSLCVMYYLQDKNTSTELLKSRRVSMVSNLRNVIRIISDRHVFCVLTLRYFLYNIIRIEYALEVFKIENCIPSNPNYWEYHIFVIQNEVDTEIIRSKRIYIIIYSYTSYVIFTDK